MKSKAKSTAVIVVFSVLASLYACTKGANPSDPGASYSPTPTGTITLTCTETPDYSATATPTVTTTGTSTLTATETATTTITGTITPTATITPNVCIVFGCEINDNGITTASLNRTYVQKYSLGQAATIRSIVLRAWNQGNFKIGIYADSSGCPGALLVTNTDYTNLSPSGWYTIGVPDTALAAGDYWIAVTCQTSGDMGVYNTAGGTIYYDLSMQNRNVRFSAK